MQLLSLVSGVVLIAFASVCVLQFKSEVEIQSALREGTENALAEVVQITLEDRAEASFKDINNPKTLVHPFNKKLKIAKVWDVLPDPLLSANKFAILVRVLVLMRGWELRSPLCLTQRTRSASSLQSYDILPSTDIKSKTIKEREARALLSGVAKKGHGDSIQGSILLPSASNEEEVRGAVMCVLLDSEGCPVVLTSWNLRPSFRRSKTSSRPRSSPTSASTSCRWSLSRAYVRIFAVP